MKIYKLRFNCSSFQDIVVRAKSKKQARAIAQNIVKCPQDGMEFWEFLSIENGDIPYNL